MFEPLGKPRKLPFPLYNQETNGNTTDDLGFEPNDFIWPDDPEERTVVPFFLSQREFTAIASSVDVGADIAYPEQYIEVWWLLVRSLRYRVPICEQIIECINTDQDTKDAIVQMLIDSGEFNDYLSSEVTRLTEGQITGKIIVDDCDNSSLMGKIKAIVDRMNTANEDFLEIIEVGTNDEEKLAAILSAVPGLKGLNPGDVIDFMQDILEDFSENYNAAITDERKLELYCGLYCEAKERPDCSISYQNIFDFFNARIGSSLTIGSVLYDVINFVLDGDFNTDDAIVNGMFMMQAGLILTAQQMGGMTLPSISLATRDAVPSTLWEECDDCPEPPMAYTLVNVAPEYTRPDPLFISSSPDGEIWEFYGVNVGHPSYSNLASVKDIDNRCFYVKAITFVEGNFGMFYQEHCGGGIDASSTLSDMIGLQEQTIQTYNTGTPYATVRATISETP